MLSAIDIQCCLEADMSLWIVLGHIIAENFFDGGKRMKTLLKLGVSLAGLNQRELACATFAKVSQKYPDSSRAVRRNVAYEQNAARCLTN